ncbi:MAG: 3-hydroxyanthranilate 3,4-dioxygenase [Alphaproteobacteria bacterium]|nr:3-hydroxyanthranilate 3,4-dioxygenase [Alphaproteobacteria bacterium]
MSILDQPSPPVSELAFRQPFNFQKWIDENRHFLNPPFGHKPLNQNGGIIVMVVGGPNPRVHFHDDPAEEFFYQLKGDMILKIADRGKIYDVTIREGDVFLLPPHTIHSPQRPVADSVGLVIEGARRPGDIDGFEWYCFECGGKVHRVEVELKDIVKDLPPLYDAFYADEKARVCPHCGSVHPGKVPPPGWVKI